MSLSQDAAIERLNLALRPCFAAHYSARGVQVNGDPHCRLGSRVAAADGGSDGIIAEWHWDGEQLTVRNDRYGMYPLFYSCHGGTIRVSPAIRHVLAEDTPRDIDYTALAVFLRLGHFVGEDTPFAHVRFLPPNSILTWRDGELAINRQPLAIGHEYAASLGFDDAVDQYIELFRDAVRRRLPAEGHFSVPLSGGRDSRHILFALDELGHRPDTCPTVKYRPPATNEDLRIAGLLCEELGIEHVQLEKPSSWQRSVVKDIHLTNFCGGGHAWILPLAAYMNGYATTMFDGLAGDVLSGGHMVNQEKIRLFEANKLRELAHTFLSEQGKEGFNRTVLRRPFADRAGMPVAVERVVRELERHREARNPVLSFVFWNRTRRMVATIPYSIFSSVPVVHTPYLDHALFDFLANVDGAFFLGNRLHDEAIRRAYPRYAHIPYEDNSKRAVYTRADHRYYARAVRELWGYLRRRGLQQPSEMIRKEYILPRTLCDRFRRRNPMPWYLMTTLYALELEALRDGR